ncbi:hypothetical protein D3C83_74150 [compost metagenome]
MFGGPVVGDTTPTDTSLPTTDTAVPATGTDTGSYDGNGTGSYDSGAGASTTTDTAPAESAPVAPAPTTNLVQEAAPISGTPMTLVDTSSIYLILVAGATRIR